MTHNTASTKNLDLPIHTQKEPKQAKTSKPNQSKNPKRFNKSLTVARSVEHVVAPNESFSPRNTRHLADLSETDDGGKQLVVADPARLSDGLLPGAVEDKLQERLRAAEDG